MTIEQLMEEYWKAAMNNAIVYRAETLFRTGECSEVESLKIAIVGLVEQNEKLRQELIAIIIKESDTSFNRRSI